MTPATVPGSAIGFDRSGNTTYRTRKATAATATSAVTAASSPPPDRRRGGAGGTAGAQP
jgi:hypothetical protein